jgi:hypothetical protein
MKFVATHGESVGGVKSKEYRIWSGIRTRCLNKNDKAYFKYGGRNITLCERWMTFSNFLSDMGRCPEGKSIDRIDNNKGYCPDNCKWSTFTEQNRNKRNNRLFTVNGTTLCVSQWVIKTGLSHRTLRRRIMRGCSEDEFIKGSFIKKDNHYGKEKTNVDMSRVEVLARVVQPDYPANDGIPNQEE